MNEPTKSSISDPETSPLREFRALSSAVPVESPEHVAARRPELVEAIAKEISATHRSRNWRPLVLASVAAAALLAFGAAQMLHPPEMTRTSGAPQQQAASVDSAEQTQITALTGLLTQNRGTHKEDTLRVGQHLAPGTELTTGRGSEAHLLLPGQTAIEVAASSVLRLEETAKSSQLLRLGKGAVLVDVPHRKDEPRRVAVLTPQAEVHVRGTRFSVQVEPDASRTTVVVERGTVEVVSNGAHFLLHAGARWTSSTTAASPLRSQNTHLLPPAPQAAERTIAAPGPTKVAGLSLAEQNARLAAALRLARKGDNEGARLALLALLAEAPDTPLQGAIHAELNQLKSPE